MARSAIRSRECQCAETEAFFQYGSQSIFDLSWLALQKAHAREVSATMMTNQTSTPPLLWLAPQSDHGRAACAETEAFFQYGPPQSFFQLAGSPYKKHAGAQISKPPPSYGSLRNYKKHAPPSWRSLRNPWRLARRSPSSSSARSPYKKNACGKLRNDDDKAQISRSPPSLWLAPQSDHGSATRAETEAFFQYGPPQSFFEPSWLALYKSTSGS